MACPAHVGSSSTKPVPTPKPTLVPTPSPTATPVISDAGSYALLVMAGDEQAILFHVNGRLANETAWTHQTRTPGVTHLDLTVSSSSDPVSDVTYDYSLAKPVFPMESAGPIPHLLIGTRNQDPATGRPPQTPIPVC